MLTIRLATETDLDELCSFDPIARQETSRVEYIQRSIQTNACYAAIDGIIKGYAIMDHSFFENGFIHLLYIHPDWRRHGVGAALLQHLEQTCQTPKLFTSTNLSNYPMQALLARLGYKLSGVIHDLDEGDPELFYVRYLR